MRKPPRMVKARSSRESQLVLETEEEAPSFEGLTEVESGGDEADGKKYER